MARCQALVDGRLECGWVEEADADAATVGLLIARWPQTRDAPLDLQALPAEDVCGIDRQFDVDVKDVAQTQTVPQAALVVEIARTDIPGLRLFRGLWLAVATIEPHLDVQRDPEPTVPAPLGKTPRVRAC